MEFGKVSLSELNEIDLKLPEDDPRTWIALKNRASNDSVLRVGVGAPVWGVKNWVGKVYPPGAQPKDFLEHYARQFNSIELNTTHYRTPDPATVQRWREVTPEGFKFNVKILQEISHRRPLDARSEIAREFVARTMELEDRLGLAFLQLPPTFAPMDLPALDRFLSGLPTGFPIAVEVRHPGFFEEHRLLASYYDLLSKKGAHVVITDVAGRRNVLHTSLPTPKFLLRFIGNDLHPTDHSRVDEWVARLATWKHLGLEQVEFFVHQPEDTSAPDLIAPLIEKLNASLGISLGNWTPAVSGSQLGFFD